MNEHQLTRALTSAAGSIRPAPDAARLQAGMRRHDRLRRIKATSAAGALSALATLGVFLAIPDDRPDAVDVTDQQPTAPDPGDPSPGVPRIDDAANVSTTTTPPIDEAGPSHLELGATTTVAPTTTAAPAPTTTSTAPPPTTTAAPATTTVAPTTTVAAHAPLTAEARYGSCEEDPPYDEYSGFGEPGVTVTLTSAWSAPTSTTIDGGGQWSTRVEFPSAPVGEHFTVTASDGETSVLLDFVRTA